MLSLIILAAISCVHADNYVNMDGDKWIMCAATVAPVTTTVNGLSGYRKCEPEDFTEVPAGLQVQCSETAQKIGPVDPTLWSKVRSCNGMSGPIAGIFINNLYECLR